jgi:hypothetical protein
VPICVRVAEGREHTAGPSVACTRTWGTSMSAHGAQGCYAAANAAVDGWARRMQAAGGACLSVLWGAWASGMAARHREFLGRLAKAGMHAITPEAGLAALEELLLAGWVLPWSRAAGVALATPFRCGGHSCA